MLMIITPLARCCSCVSLYCKGNDGAVINNRDTILVIGDIFDILVLPFFGVEYCRQKNSVHENIDFFIVAL